MFVNPNLAGISRRKVKRTNTSSGYRLDMAERLSDYDTDVFDKFMSTLTVEYLIIYPSDILEQEVNKKIALSNKVDQKNVMIDAGSDSVIKNIFQTFGDPEKKILVTSPSFPMYEIYAKGLGLGVSEHKISSHTSLNLNALLQSAVLDDVSIVAIANPGSPFGNMESFDRISSFAGMLKLKGIRLLLDEAYVDFSTGGYEKLREQHDNVLLVRTFSKGWGAAGCRVGYCLSSKLNITELHKVRLTYPISNVSLKFVDFLLKNEELVTDYCARTIVERNELVKKLNGFGYTSLQSENNTIHIGGTKDKINYLISIFKKHDVAFKDLTNTSFQIENKYAKSLIWVRISVGEGILKSVYMEDLFSKIFE